MIIKSISISFSSIYYHQAKVSIVNLTIVPTRSQSSFYNNGFAIKVKFLSSLKFLVCQQIWKNPENSNFQFWTFQVCSIIVNCHQLGSSKNVERI